MTPSIITWHQHGTLKGIWQSTRELWTMQRAWLKLSTDGRWNIFAHLCCYLLLRWDAWLFLPFTHLDCLFWGCCLFGGFFAKLCAFPKSSVLFQFICGPLPALMSCSSAGWHASTCASSSPCCAGEDSLSDVGSMCFGSLSLSLSLSLSVSIFLSPESLKGLVAGRVLGEETASRRAGWREVSR